MRINVYLFSLNVFCRKNAYMCDKASIIIILVIKYIYNSTIF